MSQHSDIQLTSLEDILEILQSEAQAMPYSPTSIRYLRALDSWGAVILTAGPKCPIASSTPSLTHSDNAQKSADTASRADTAANAADTHNDNSSFIINNLSLSLTDWLVNQWLMNTPFSTASLYLDIISSLYGSAVKGGLLPKNKVFSELKARLKALGPDGWKSGIDDEIFTRALRLTRNASFLISDDAIAADLILWSLNHSLQPLEEIALLKREDIMGGGHSDRQAAGLLAQNPTTSGLLQVKQEQGGLSSDAPLVAQKTEDPRLLSVIFNNLSLADARRKYVFPLHQSERTPLQLSRHIKKIVNALFKRARLPQSTDPYQTVEALWAYAALRAGIPASQLVSYLGHAPLGLPVLKLYGGAASQPPVSGGESSSSPSADQARVRELSSEWAVGLSQGKNITPAANTASADPAPRADTPYCEADTDSSASSASHAPQRFDTALRANTPYCEADTDSSASSASHATQRFDPAPRADTSYCEADTDSSASSASHAPQRFDTAPRADTSYCEADTAPDPSEDLRLKTEDLAAIGRVFLENPPRWYAMSLRPGVRFTQVCQRIQLLLKTQDSRLKTEDLTLFYPCEEIARAIGKKIVIRQRPFIHSVVFFRAKLTDIGRLFAKIGDLAWCYRQSARPGAPYADISERQFQLFQQTIARFTPDYEVAPTGELELRKNDRVQILGGLFAGHEAIMEQRLPSRPVSSGNNIAHGAEAGRLRSQSNSNSSARAVPENSKRKTDNVKDTARSADTPSVVYRLNIVGDNGIEWRVNVDSRLLKPNS